MNRTHLSDDRLIELCVAGGSSEPHLAKCDRCMSRLAVLATTLDDVNLSMRADADKAFPADRLARQQARILQRIELEGRPARVIAFPAMYTPAARFVRRPSRRWIAAAGAVAASFVVGILADQLTHGFPTVRSVATPRVVARASDQSVPIRTVAASVSDDEFLGQVEAAAGSTGPTALRALDAMTPRAWDVR
jgi:hypothetical protein